MSAFYFDSSVLVAIYIPEKFSAAARRTVRAVPGILFTPLHRLEVSNAFELLEGRGLLSRDERQAVREHLRDDVESARLVATDIDLGTVYSDATVLAERYSAKHLARGLDLLHVAASKALACTDFVSADDRQLAVAKAVGLRTVDIKRAIRTPRGNPS